MFNRCLFLAYFLCSSAAGAGERVLTTDELRQVLTDKSLYAEGRAGVIEQIFQASGVTFYLENGGVSKGFWKIEGGQYCSQWPPNQSWACYDVLGDETGVVFVSAAGERFPMRFGKP